MNKTKQSEFNKLFHNKKFKKEGKLSAVDCGAEIILKPGAGAKIIFITVLRSRS